VREGWPEPPAIRLREAFPGEADGLAGESSANKVNCGSSTASVVSDQPGFATSFANDPLVRRRGPFGLPRRIVFSLMVAGTQASAAFGVGQ
jgi:hypothetical protein